MKYTLNTDKISIVLKEKGLTEHELLQKCSISSSTYKRIKKEKQASLLTIAKIAINLKIDIKELI